MVSLSGIYFGFSGACHMRKNETLPSHASVYHSFVAVLLQTLSLSPLECVHAHICWHICEKMRLVWKNAWNTMYRNRMKPWSIRNVKWALAEKSMFVCNKCSVALGRCWRKRIRLPKKGLEYSPVAAFKHVTSIVGVAKKCCLILMDKQIHSISYCFLNRHEGRDLPKWLGSCAKKGWTCNI